ncbi:MAG: hypothetical protein PVF87_06280 [Acidimicrobiia bacterium]|jgi:hypothetical protein
MSRALAWAVFACYVVAWVPGYMYDGVSLERTTTLDLVSLRDDTAPDSIVAGWLEVVSETMQPNAIGVWTRNNS